MKYIEGKGYKLNLFSVASRVIENVEDDVKDRLVKANKIEKPNEDLLYVEFVLCHEGTNDNKDEFLIAELRDNFDTIKFKDINVEHTNRIIGCIYDAELVENEADAKFTLAEGFKPHIVCSSVIYQYKFPEEAQEIVDRHENEELTFSMETWFKAARCSDCGGEFEKVAAYCNCLTNRFSSGSKVSRQLIGITFGGAAVVKSPADKGAKGLSVAKEGAEAVRDVDTWDVSMVVNTIGESSSNLKEVLKSWVKEMDENDMIGPGKALEVLQNIVNELTGNNSNANNARGGKKLDNYKEFKTKEDFEKVIAEIVNKQVEAKLSEQDVENKIEELNGKIEAQEKEVQKITEAKEKVEKEFEDYKEEQKKTEEERKVNEQVEARYKELTEAGFEAEDEEEEAFIKDELKTKDEEAYAKYKKVLLKNVKAKKDDEEDEDEDRSKAAFNNGRQESFASAKSNGKFEWEKDADEAFSGLTFVEVEEEKN